jgi:hypothetical protein
MKVSLQLGRNPDMGRKQLENHPQLKEVYSLQLSGLMEGLKVLITPSEVVTLDQGSQKLIFEFTHFIIEKYFGLILNLSRQEGNAEFFSYTLSIVSEGLQSTQSISLLTSFDCIDSMHQFAIKGSKFYKEAMKELL